MNSPDIHVPESAAAADDSEEIYVLRTQINDLAEKARNLRPTWRGGAAVAFLGLIAPIGVAGLILLVSFVADQRVKDIDNTYSEKIEEIAKEHLLKDFIKGKETTEEKIEAMKDKAPAVKRDEVQKALNAAEVEYKKKRARATLESSSPDLAMTIAVGAVFCLPWIFPVIYVIWIWLSKRMMERARHKLEYKLIEAKGRQLQDQIGEDFFTRLVQINFKYLDQYYFQTHQQANKSFALSVAASVVGLAIVLIGIAMMFATNKVDEARVTAAAGVLSQFIAAVFFYLYNRTVMKMGEYHKKLVLTQNIGIALKITDLLPAAERAETQRTLVGQLTHNINQHLSEIESAGAAPLAAS